MGSLQITVNTHTPMLMYSNPNMSQQNDHMILVIWKYLNSSNSSRRFHIPCRRASWDEEQTVVVVVVVVVVVAAAAAAVAVVVVVVLVVVVVAASFILSRTQQ